MAGTEVPCIFDTTLPYLREDAFALFVDRMAAWWPNEYTFSHDPDCHLSIEPMVGGACTELAPGRPRIVWGTVLSIERPLYIRLAWQIGPNREVIADPAASSRVMVEFRTAADGTRVELTHTDFLRHGDGADAYREAMSAPEGWPLCLARLAEAARARK
ncbi:SRPBCC family protein [Stappia sp.]|jgi:uncharacterized protein YndB with AHSA1/START domain|uniref:SRPBCC family protein n=1 Tax=Stappia sp. TaxID=1870903 RepID=UPI003A997975